MAVSRNLLRSPTTQTLKSLLLPLRSLSSTTAPDPDHHHNHHQQNHEYLSPNNYINSWNPPKNPREAELQLVKLRREYAKKVKEVRKKYIQEMELQRIEKQIRDEKKKEALRIANEERKAAKAAAKKAKAAERQVAEEEFRQTLNGWIQQTEVDLLMVRAGLVKQRKGVRQWVWIQEGKDWVELKQTVLGKLVLVKEGWASSSGIVFFPFLELEQCTANNLNLSLTWISNGIAQGFYWPLLDEDLLELCEESVGVKRFLGVAMGCRGDFNGPKRTLLPWSYYECTAPKGHIKAAKFIFCDLNSISRNNGEHLAATEPDIALIVFVIGTSLLILLSDSFSSILHVFPRFHDYLQEGNAFLLGPVMEHDHLYHMRSLAIRWHSPIYFRARLDNLAWIFSIIRLKERMEKLEYWRKRVKQVEEKKKEKNELLRRQSSIWIEEEKLGKKIFEAVVDGGALN
ncbi:hypothetical protein LguiA_029923 [Lonicera macranthoides]